MTYHVNFLNKLILIFSLIFVCLIISSAVCYGAATPTAKGKVTDPDGANIRSTYSTSGSIEGSVPQDGIVTITKEKYTSSSSTASDTRWYYVKGGYGNGWIRADLLSITYSSYSGNATDSLNVRKGPGTSFSVVGTLSSGDAVSVRLKTYSSTGEEWYKILYDGSNRYINADYVKLAEADAENNTSFDQELAAFPSSYHAYLNALHEEYPSWHFVAKDLSYSWSSALDAQCENYETNTIPSSFKDSYKAVRKGTYDFTYGTYIGMDGSDWVAASRQAVAYYMDPRNWLDEINVFMFESLSYDASTQSETMVKELLSSTAIPTSYSSSYMLAGDTYDISPVYLAAKSKLELGSSSFMVDGHTFTYNGKTYSGYYNAYNIGAADSAAGNAALNGLYFAASGYSYLRPWNTLDKAIRGGAKFIAEDFIGNNQHTLYYERFNVANGLSGIGTHQYMTNTFAPATQANITYWNYSDNGMLDTPFTFEIPVYKNLPATVAARPGSGNNNNYLDTLKVYDGSTRKYFTVDFSRFTTTYTLKNNIGYDVEKLTVKTTTNDSGAKVSISGNTGLKSGSNKITIKVTSSSGAVRYYYVKVTKDECDSVEAPVVIANNNPVTGKPLLTWEAAANADKYEIYRSTSADGTYTKIYTKTGTTFTNTGAVTGEKYYYKVKSIGTSGVDGSAMSKSVARTCDLPQTTATASNKESTGKPVVTWDTIKDAESYAVYRSTDKAGPYSKIFSTKKTTYTNTAAEAGVKYYYKIKAIHENSAANSALSEAVARTCDLVQPSVTAENNPSNGKPVVIWDEIKDANSYVVYRSKEKDGTYTKVFTTSKTSYTNTAAETGEKYYYKVKAIHENSAANSVFSEVVVRTCDLPQPVVTADNDPITGKPQLIWKSIAGAEEYEIYLSTDKDGTYTRSFKTENTIFTNESIEAGAKYYYKVKAIHENSTANSALSESVVRTCDFPQPVLTVSNKVSTGKPQLTWDPIEGAKQYEIYRSVSSNGKYEKLYTKAGTTFTNTSAENGVKYYYKIKAIHENSAANSVLSEAVARTCDLPQPQTSVDHHPSSGKPRIIWKAIDGAESYVVYRSTSKDGTYSKMFSTKGISYTNTSAKSGKKYYYKVKALHENSSANSVFSEIKSCTCL